MPITKRPRSQSTNNDDITAAAIPPEIRTSWFACTAILLEPFAVYVVTVVLRPSRAPKVASDAMATSKFTLP